MDTLHSVLFYALATVTVGGALGTALGPARLRAITMGVVAIGLAGLYADLSAGFAGLIALLAYLAIAVLARGQVAVDANMAQQPRGVAHQLAGPLAAVVFAVLAYMAWRSGFHPGFRSAGEINGTALGRLLVNRDALALEALGLALLVGAVAASLGFGARR